MSLLPAQKAQVFRRNSHVQLVRLLQQVLFLSAEGPIRPTQLHG